MKKTKLLIITMILFIILNILLVVVPKNSYATLNEFSFLYVNGKYLYGNLRERIGEGPVDNSNADVSGATYDVNTNTLTLNNYDGDYIMFGYLGNDFKINIVGNNSITNNYEGFGIVLPQVGTGEEEGACDITFIGNGSLNISGGVIHAENIAMNGPSLKITSNHISVTCENLNFIKGKLEAIKTSNDYQGNALYCRNDIIYTDEIIFNNSDPKHVIIIEKEDILYGDINNDGSVNITDEIYFGRYLSEYPGYTLDKQTENNADINNDGVVDWEDYKVLRKYRVGEQGYTELPKEYVLYGDINHDYKTDIMDEIYFGRYLSEYPGYTLDKQTEKNADVNNDGKVDWEDYKVLRKYRAGEQGYTELPKDYILYGDINHDYKINIIDEIYFGRYLSNYDGYTLDRQTEKNADINNDGKVDWEDYKVLKKYRAGEQGYTELPKEYILYGDINHDYKTDIMDEIYFGRYLSNYDGYTLDRQTEKNADTNDDGVVDWEDYKVLKKYRAGEQGYTELPKGYVLYGDINHDYKIDITDEIYFGRYLSNYEGYTLDKQTEKNADVNNDGKVDWEDYKVLKKYRAGETGYENLPYLEKHNLILMDGNTEYSRLEFAKGETITLADTPTKTGYLFNGLCENAELSITTPEDFVMGDSDITVYISWTEKEYTVNYDANKGTGTTMELSRCNYTSSLDLPGCDYTYEEHDFLGWDTHSDVTTPEYVPGDETKGTILGTDLANMVDPNNNLTLYAIWKEIPSTYRITYMVGSVEVGYEDYAPGATITTIDVPVPEGQSFDAWCEDSELTRTVPNPFTMPEENITVYARFITEQPPQIDDYTITYMVGNIQVGQETYAPGATITTIDVPSANVPEGQSFDAWCEDSELTRTVPNPFTMPEENITVYARFITEQPPQIDDYTITYNKNSETATGEMQTSIFIPDSNDVSFHMCAYQNTGYSFTGWATDENGTNIIMEYDKWGGTTGQISGETLATYAVNKQVTLYAVWGVQKLEVYVDGYEKLQMFYDTTHNEPVLDEEGNPIYSYLPMNKIIEVNYNSTISQDNGILLDLDERGGYTFEGWYQDEEGNMSQTEFDFTTPITQNIFLKAKWSFNLEYDLNGGTIPNNGTIPSQNVMEGENITISNIEPELEGATFLGWSSSRNQYSPEFEILFKPGETYSTRNMFSNKIYAYWSFDTTTIFYDLLGGELQGGGTIPNGIATKGTPFTVTSEEPTLGEGRTFIGWSTIPDEDVPWIECKSGETLENTEGQATAEITLYAKYAYNTMNISYNIQPGTIPTEQASLIASHTITYNTDFDLPEITPIYPGYTFKGWSVYPSASQEEILTGTIRIVDFATATIQAHAVWELTWIDESIKDEENKTITYTIDNADKLQQLSWNIRQIEGNKEYNHIFNISGDLQLNDQITFNENSTVNILGTLELNNSIDLKGATLSLLTTQETGLNISSWGGISADANANLTIDGKSLVGNEVDSCIDLVANEQNDESIYISEVVINGMDYNNQPFTEYGTSINVDRGVATLKNANNTNASSFNVTSNDDLTIESNGKLIVDYNIIVEGNLTIRGELNINENKTVTLINNSSLQKNENSVTGLGTLIDNRTVYIIYDLRGGNLDLSGYAHTASKHENFTLPAEPTWEGYGFLGWQVTDGNASEQYDAGEIINFDMIQENQVEINAMWGRRTQ